MIFRFVILNLGLLFFERYFYFLESSQFDSQLVIGLLDRRSQSGSREDYFPRVEYQSRF